MSKLKWYLSGFVGLLIFQSGFGFADEMKRDLFILGVQLGGAECMASRHEAYPISEKPGAFELIERNVGWSLDTARRMGNPANTLASLRSRLSQLTFSEIRTSLLDIIETEQMSWASLSTQASGLFVLGVHLEGAECIASGVQSFSREEKPGSLELIRRNVSWVRQEVQNLNMGLSSGPVDDLIQRIEEGGAPFQEIERRLAEIRLLWQDELLDQPPF